MKHHTYIDSPLGRMLITSAGSAVTGVYFVGQKYQPVPTDDSTDLPGVEPLAQARIELAEYFAGTRQRFDVSLTPSGTPFQERVWRALTTIPFGATSSYLELARFIDAADSVRAVGAAVGRNPISIVIPCHRVIGSDGSLTGYAGGLERKRKLLALEADAGPLLRYALNACVCGVRVAADSAYGEPT